MCTQYSINKILLGARWSMSTIWLSHTADTNERLRSFFNFYCESTSTFLDFNYRMWVSRKRMRMNEDWHHRKERHRIRARASCNTFSVLSVVIGCPAAINKERRKNHSSMRINISSFICPMFAATHTQNLHVLFNWRQRDTWKKSPNGKYFGSCWYIIDFNGARFKFNVSPKV